jgi:hypothetical protein
MITSAEEGLMPGQPGRHDEVELKPVAHRIVTSWPPGTFVENLAVLPSGGFVASLHNRPVDRRCSAATTLRPRTSSAA